MKLGVGMYVRTEKGIAKLLNKADDINPSYLYDWETDTQLKIYYDTTYVYEEDIIKTSYNIIDLIEENDFVNEEKIIKHGDELGFYSIDMGEEYFYTLKDIQIKSILTHEQFEKMAYKVVE